MSNFHFRLRFHFLDGDNVACNEEELLLLEKPDGFRLRLKSGAMGEPIKNNSRAALIGGPYSSEEEAYAAGEIAKRSLLIWAVSNRFGIDFGDGKTRSLFTDEGLKILAVQNGRPFRNDIHGIDVYEHHDDLQFVLFEAKASVGKETEAFIKSVSSDFQNPVQLTKRQIVSSELYCSSYFDVSFRSRVITLISAIEALLELSDRKPEAVDLVEEIKKTVKASRLEDNVISSMLGSLQWLSKKSISQTGRELSNRLLPNNTYMGKSSESFFSFCYGLRSQIVHNGCPANQELDLLEVANALQAFVGDMILASVNQYTA